MTKIKEKSLARLGMEKLAWQAAGAFVRRGVYHMLASYSSAVPSEVSMRVGGMAWNSIFHGGVDPEQMKWGKNMGLVIMGLGADAATAFGLYKIFSMVIPSNNEKEGKQFTLPPGFDQKDPTYIPGQPLPGCTFSRKEARLGAEIVRQEMEAMKKTSSCSFTAGIAVKAGIAVVAGLGLMMLSRQQMVSEGIQEMQRMIGWIECKTVTVDGKGNPVKMSQLTEVLLRNKTLYEEAQGWCSVTK